MIIDAHTHGMNGRNLEAFARAGGDFTREIAEFQRQKAKNRPEALDVAHRVRLLDKFGYDYQVVTPPGGGDVVTIPGDPVRSLEIARRVNENMSTLRDDSQGRLIPIGAIPLPGFSDDSAAEMERAVRILGLKGMTIPSHVMGQPLSRPEFELFWAKAAELDTAVYIHPKNVQQSVDRCYEDEYDLAHCFGWPFETTLALSHLVFSGIMERYPGLKVVSHHLGGMISFFWGRILETYDPSLEEIFYNREMFVDHALPKPLYNYFSRFYYDTAVGGNSAGIRCAYDVFGANQIVFATDAPMGPEHGEKRLRTYPEVVRSLKLPHDEEDKIMGGNIMRVLGDPTS